MIKIPLSGTFSGAPPQNTEFKVSGNEFSQIQLLWSLVTFFFSMIQHPEERRSIRTGLLSVVLLLMLLLLLDVGSEWVVDEKSRGCAMPQFLYYLASTAAAVTTNHRDRSVLFCYVLEWAKQRQQDFKSIIWVTWHSPRGWNGNPITASRTTACRISAKMSHHLLFGCRPFYGAEEYWEEPAGHPWCRCRTEWDRST